MFLTLLNRIKEFLDGFSLPVDDILIGLLTGLVSSLVVTYYYRFRDNKRDARLFLRHWINYISDISYQLVAIDFAASQARDMTYDYDIYFEKILSLYRSKPIYEQRYRIIPEVKLFYSEYKAISDRLHARLNDYNRCKNVLSVYSRDHLSMDKEERENNIRREQANRYRTVRSLLPINVDLLSLRRKLTHTDDD